MQIARTEDFFLVIGAYLAILSRSIFSSSEMGECVEFL
jgi:hypothetical protein